VSYVRLISRVRQRSGITPSRTTALERKLLFLGVIGTYSSRTERLRIVCDHYLDLGQGLHEGSGKAAIWPCPACGRVSFVASFDEGLAGCAQEGCEIPASMGLLEFIAYLDEGLEVGDERGASEKFGEILEAAVRREQEYEAERKEGRRRAREERYWQKGLKGARESEQGSSEERLF
jgi:hypothetical protein